MGAVFQNSLWKMHQSTAPLGVSALVLWTLCFPDPTWAQQASRLASTGEAEVESKTETKEAEIKKWIEMLGAEQFASRQRAQMELELLGLEAFELLREAFDHPDREVASMARYLINSASVEWANENDPPAVREVLKNYDVRPMSTRKDLMDRLSSLPKREGWAPLCRIAKFEPSNSLAKYAALLILQKRKELKPDDRLALAELIRKEVGPSRRTSVQWLQSFATLLSQSTVDTQTWYQIAENEHALLDAGSDDTFPGIVQNLYQWAAILGNDSDEREKGLRMARGAIRIVGNDLLGLREAAYWVIDHGFPELVEEMQQENQVFFSKYAELTYSLAESYRARKMEANAEEFAEIAFKNPSAGIVAARDPREYRTFRAFGLQQRGLFDWSEREYRETLKNTRPLDVVALKARYFFTEMLHDIGKNQDASDVWSEILVELERSGEPYRQQLHVQLDLAGLDDPAGVIGQAYYYQAIALIENNELSRAKIKLNYAFDNDPDNADVLIAMHRLDGDEQWKRTVSQRVKTCADYFQAQMIQKEQEMESSGALGVARAKRDLARMNNQYAWLISNTEGDFQQALRCSQRSLELEPDLSTYLDTLGRCYFAVGDYQNAILNQRRAVELEPFSMSMKRQLQLFEETVQQQQEKP